MKTTKFRRWAKLFLILAVTPFLLAAAPNGCATNLLKAGNAINTLSSAITYEPTQTDIEAEHRAFLNVLEANRVATERWMQQTRIPVPHGWYETQPPESGVQTPNAVPPSLHHE